MLSGVQRHAQGVQLKHETASDLAQCCLDACPPLPLLRGAGEAGLLAASHSAAAAGPLHKLGTPQPQR